MPIKILNYRLGFAKNSSSTHTVIFGDGLSKIYKDNHPDTDFEYGWEDFTLVSKEEKDKYVATILWQNLRYTDSEDDSLEVFSKYYPQYLNEMKKSYIDHQSHITLPFYYHQNRINLTFFEHLREYLLQDDVLILGGNDNGDGHYIVNGLENRDKGPHYVTDYVTGYRKHDNIDFVKFDIHDILYGERFVAVYNENGNFWSLFSRKSGKKIRLSFSDITSDPSKSSSPELVDIKITDFCPYGCKFCYVS